MSGLTPITGHTIREGHVCVIYISEHMKHIFKVNKDSELPTKFGHLRGIDLIGHNYGVKFNLKKGWIIPLKLTPELWTQLLPHRTQVLYLSDISLMLLHLKIKPGSIVVESGTGSGSMSHSILRAIRPKGHLYTFEFNKSRADEARKEFIEHGYGDNVTVANVNAYTDGFGSDLDGKADSCLLDLPNTWEAIWAAHKALKTSGSLCTFSPCIGQVENNVAKMLELGFEQIQTFESLMRPLDVRSEELRNWDTSLESLRQKALRRLESLKSKRVRMDLDGDDAIIQDPVSSCADPSDAPNSIQSPVDQVKRGDGNNCVPDDVIKPPLMKYTHAKQQLSHTSHSGFLTFATKRGL